MDISPDLRLMVWVAFKAFLISLILTPILRDVFRAYNVVDRPDRRKIHAYPIPRVGGIPVAIAYLASLVSITDFTSSLPGYNSPVWKLIPGAAVIFLVGLADDFFNLKPRLKLLGQVAAAAIVYAGGLRVEALAGTVLPIWLSFIITISWLLLTSNALNLIDGLDGLCAGMGLMATLTLFGAGMMQGNIPLAQATFPLAGALLGFLCYNFNLATVFMGDSGALLIGFLLGCYGMIWTDKSATVVSIIVPLLAMSIPIMDVSLSILRRFLRNHPIFSADRGHIHHRLLDRGLSPRGAVLVLYLVAALAAIFALLLSYSKLGRYQIFVILLFCVVASLGIRQLRYAEFGIAARLLFRGGFQNTVKNTLQIESLAISLSLASTEEQWWNVLCTAARDLDWVSMRCVTQRGTYEQILAPRLPHWSFRVPLSANDEFIQIEGFSSQISNSSIDLPGFAETVRLSFSAKQHVWEQPVLR